MKVINNLLLIILIAFSFYLVIVFGLYIFQRQIIYVPSNFMLSPKETGVPDMKEHQVTSVDGISLTFWYKSADINKPTIIYFHGNAGNLSGRTYKIKPYLDAGYGVLLCAYRGYGSNLGKPTEIGLYNDARAQLNYLKELGVHSQNWFLYGESLGTGIAVNMAFEISTNNNLNTPLISLGGLILEAPFLSLPKIAQEHYPFVPARFIVWDKYNSISKINQINTPVLFIHGQKDEVISIKHGKTLFQAAKHPKQAKWIPIAGHNNLYEFGMADLVISFIEKYKNSEN